MDKTGHAFFVDFPRRIEDLKKPNDIRLEQAYEVVKTIRLGSMDYENFITDMVADRQFIEDNHVLCSVGKVWKCLLVQGRGRKGGILVMPVDQCYAKYAAYIEE